MPGTLQDHVAIVAGASSGMGQATALALAQAGMRVMAAGRRLDKLQQLAAAAPDPIECCQTDVTSRAAVDKLVEQTLTKWQRIDLLVFAAGTNLPQRSLQNLTAAGWEELLSTNLTGAFHCTQAVLPTMRSQSSGLIIYLSTGAVQRPDASGVAYQASKHGLSGLAHGTRVEEQKNGIRTSVIFPGLCETEILLKRPAPTPREILDLALQPEDIAAAVLFIAQLPPRAVVPELQLLPSRL